MFRNFCRAEGVDPCLTDVVFRVERRPGAWRSVHGQAVIPLATAAAIYRAVGAEPPPEESKALKLYNIYKRHIQGGWRGRSIDIPYSEARRETLVG